MSEREKIYQKTDGRCYYCGCELPDRWHVDHLFPKNKEHWLGNEVMMEETCAPNDLKSIEEFRNKVPSCPRCNIRKGALDVEQFRDEISQQVKRLKRDVSQFQLALDYGLVEETDKEVVFYFETMTDN